MPLINSSSVLSIKEWSGVATSLTGSVLNAHGRRCSFVLWPLSALLQGTVTFSLERSGWLTLQGAGVAIIPLWNAQLARKHADTGPYVREDDRRFT